MMTSSGNVEPTSYPSPTPPTERSSVPALVAVPPQTFYVGLEEVGREKILVVTDQAGKHVAKEILYKKNEEDEDSANIFTAPGLATERQKNELLGRKFETIVRGIQRSLDDTLDNRRYQPFRLESLPTSVQSFENMRGGEPLEKIHAVSAAVLQRIGICLRDAQLIDRMRREEEDASVRAIDRSSV